MLYLFPLDVKIYFLLQEEEEEEGAKFEIESVLRWAPNMTFEDEVHLGLGWSIFDIVGRRSYSPPNGPINRRFFCFFSFSQFSRLW